MMELKKTSLTKVVKNKFKIDDEPFQVSQFEWRGTLNNGEFILVIKFNLGAFKVKIVETEYEVNNVKYMYVAQEQKPMRYMIDNNKINIDELITFLQWK